MIRSVVRVSQRDVTRLLRAVTAAGMHPARVEFDQSGKVVIQLCGGERVEPLDALDKWMAEHAD
jgi:hypothetical protein